MKSIHILSRCLGKSEHWNCRPGTKIVPVTGFPENIRTSIRARFALSYSWRPLGIGWDGNGEWEVLERQMLRQLWLLHSAQGRVCRHLAFSQLMDSLRVTKYSGDRCYNQVRIFRLEGQGYLSVPPPSFWPTNAYLMNNP